MINGCRAVVGVRIGRETEILKEKKCHIIHHNSYMAWDRNFAAAATVVSQQLTA
jgi:hypothetical protein